MTFSTILTSWVLTMSLSKHESATTNAYLLFQMRIISFFFVYFFKQNLKCQGKDNNNWEFIFVMLLLSVMWTELKKVAK